MSLIEFLTSRIRIGHGKLSSSTPLYALVLLISSSAFYERASKQTDLDDT